MNLLVRPRMLSLNFQKNRVYRISLMDREFGANFILAQNKMKQTSDVVFHGITQQADK